MATVELAIDLGSSYITIFQKGAGVILKEPSVAIVARNKKKKEIVECGAAALRSFKSSLGAAQMVYPIREGAVVSREDATLLIKEFIDRIVSGGVFTPHIKAVVAVSSGLSLVERRDVESVMIDAGVKDVVLVESPLALLAYTNSVGGLFVDIGGGTTDVAAVSKKGIANACAVNIGGNALNSRIIDFFVENYGLKIGDYTAEKLKLDIGSMYDNDLSTAEISGRDVVDGGPRVLEATARDVKAAISEPIDMIIEVIENVLNMCPPELAGEIGKKGIFICGGTSNLPGLLDYISVRLSLPVTQLMDEDNAVAEGAGILLSDRRLLSDMLNVRLD